MEERFTGSLSAGSQTQTTTITDLSITPVLAADKYNVEVAPTGFVAFAFDPAELLLNDKSSTGATLTGTPSIVSATGGTASVDATTGKWVFIPTSASVREGTITYSVSGVDSAITGTVNLTFNATPTGASATLTATEDTTVTGTLTGVDANSDTLTFAVVAGSTVGTSDLTINAATGAYSFTAAPTPDLAVGATGTTSFKYTVTDSKGAVSPEYTVTTTVTGINDQPQDKAYNPISIVAGTANTFDLTQYATDPDTTVAGCEFP